ncbi:MAG: hypothetical protein CSB49_04665 [Proteobacteria bacterium]|nr:MAG: hypothetical protein CSB49_04665 [Pseudomonadota bacterium]
MRAAVSLAFLCLFTSPGCGGRTIAQDSDSSPVASDSSPVASDSSPVADGGFAIRDLRVPSFDLGVTYKVDFWLVKGVINGQPVHSNGPPAKVRFGEPIQGTVTFEIDKIMGRPGQHFLVLVPSWGDHESSYQFQARDVPMGKSTHTVEFTFLPPPQKGSVRLIFSETMLGVHPAKQASLTSWWAMIAPSWNDGNDMADLSTPVLDACEGVGSCLCPYTNTSGAIADDFCSLKHLKVEVD